MNRVTVASISYDASGKLKLSGAKGDGYLVNVTSLGRVAIVGRNNTVPFME